MAFACHKVIFLCHLFMTNLHRLTVILVPRLPIEMVYVGQKAFSERIFIRNIWINIRIIVCKTMKYRSSFSALKLAIVFDFRTLVEVCCDEK